jgi:hypothetical protein
MSPSIPSLQDEREARDFKVLPSRTVSFLCDHTTKTTLAVHFIHQGKKGKYITKKEFKSLYTNPLSRHKRQLSWIVDVQCLAATQ